MRAGRVLVVGAGIAGAACARALRADGVDVTVVEKERTVGGRLAAPVLHGRPVDVGAAYFTGLDPTFAGLVRDWQHRGLVRAWTDTLTVFGPDGRTTSTGPLRYAATGGLSALVEDLHVDVVLDHKVTAPPDDVDAVVLAMPDPFAASIADLGIEWVDYEPVIAVVAGFARRTWTLDAAFVNDDAQVSFLADDGARRGDAAPVLVLHTTGALARQHLDDPAGAVAPALETARRLLALDAPPLWTHVHPWPVARPVATHGDAPYALVDRVGVCGDSWCPDGSPRVEAAWLSGHRLGTALARQLGSGRSV